MTTGSNTLAPRVKEWPLTPGFWMDYYGQVKEQMQGLSVEEISKTMQFYIRGVSIEDCAAYIRWGRLI